MQDAYYRGHKLADVNAKITAETFRKEAKAAKVAKELKNRRNRKFCWTAAMIACLIVWLVPSFSYDAFNFVSKKLRKFLWWYDEKVLDAIAAKIEENR